jgi:hypothetical protein
MGFMALCDVYHFYWTYCIFLTEVAQMIGVRVVIIRGFETGRRDYRMFECHSGQATWKFR